MTGKKRWIVSYFVKTGDSWINDKKSHAIIFCIKYTEIFEAVDAKEGI